MAIAMDRQLEMNVSNTLQGFPSSKAMIEALKPTEPVYCLYPQVQLDLGRRFVEDFPGRVLYAVKANPDPQVLRLLWQSGVRDFDTASLAEVELVKDLLPEATCHFMAPVRLLGAARAAYERHGVMTYVIDHPDALALLLSETGGGKGLTIFVRLAASNSIATYDLSTKFGTTPEEAITLLQQVADSGARPALAFNVGSLVMHPDAYAQALEVCRTVLETSAVPIELLDVGGGFPSAYVGLGAAPLDDFFKTIADVGTSLPLAAGAELWGEPGRALVTEGLSVVTQVLLRKDNSVYLNDGIYGNLGEPKVSNGLVFFPTRSFRLGGTLSGETAPLYLYGPTCDSIDALPEPFQLPADLKRGDYVEFGMLGAYTIACRSRFNGFFPEQMVEITDPAALPPDGLS